MSLVMLAATSCGKWVGRGFGLCFWAAVAYAAFRLVVQ